MNDGYDETALAEYRKSYDAELAQDNPTDYGYYIMEPQSDLPNEDVDFVWLDLFSDEVARQAGIDAWTGSAAEERWTEMTTCNDFLFAATAIRR